MIYAFLFLSLAINITLVKDLYMLNKQLQQARLKPKKKKQYSSDNNFNKLIHEAIKNNQSTIKLNNSGGLKYPTRKVD